MKKLLMLGVVALLATSFTGCFGKEENRVSPPMVTGAPSSLYDVDVFTMEVEGYGSCTFVWVMDGHNNGAAGGLTLVGCK